MPYNAEEGWEVSRGKGILLLIESLKKCIQAV